MKRAPRPTMPGAVAIGIARPSMPAHVLAEDFSMLIRARPSVRIVRSRLRILN